MYKKDNIKRSNLITKTDVDTGIKKQLLLIWEYFFKFFFNLGILNTQIPLLPPPTNPFLSSKKQESTKIFNANTAWLKAKRASYFLPQ